MPNEESIEDIFNQDFMANFTHQLMGPLQSIEATCLNVVEKIVTPDKADKTLRGVVAQTRECINLVRNMALIASILSADEKILVQDMYGEELTTLLIESASSYAVLAERKKCKVNLINRAEINKYPKIAVNKELLRQAVGNLLDNAIKYCSENTIIEISARRSSKDDVIHLYVTNKGIGIPENEREKIFSAKYRASNATQKIGTGTGAGLWLVRKMMQKIGGEVFCDKISKESTRFRLDLPRTNR